MSTQLILDGLVLLLLVVMMVVGLKSGFFKTVVFTIGSILSFVVAYFGSKFLAVYIYNSFITESIIESTEKFINNAGGAVKFDSVLKTTINKLPTYVKNTIMGASDSDALLADVTTKTSGSVEEIGKVIASDYAAPIILPILQAVVALILLIIILLIVKGISEMISDGLRRSVFGPVDIALGGVLGIVQGAVIVFLLVFFVKIVIFLTANEISLLSDDVIEKTSIFKHFYHFNTDVLNKWVHSFKL